VSRKVASPTGKAAPAPGSIVGESSYLNHSDEQKEQKTEWLDSHLKCFSGGSHLQLNLSLLLTCKQIYAEAHSYPLSTNTFFFIAPSSVDTFMYKTLPETKARFVKSVGIWAPIPSPIWTDWQPDMNMQKMDLLTGIEELSVFITVFEVVEHVGSIMAFYEDIIERFRGPSLNTVEVLVGYNGHKGLSRESLRILGQFVDGFKKKLLGTRS
jgi:hypothetical protein